VRATSNNTSVVLAYASDGSRPRSGPSYAGRILLTGDAERPVFSRLRDPALPEAWRLPKAGILKMPHHGSWGAIDRATLRHIQPKLAIVSHGNRRFGTHVDPHPHIEVVRALRSLKICALYTNDVVKSSGVVAPGAADGPVPGWQNVEFVK
jgi:beta-lactamase superfamily II metal-dependent hydrolase